MRTRIFFAAVLLLVALLLYSIPAVCQDEPKPAPPSEGGLPTAVTQPPAAVVTPAPAEPAAEPAKTEGEPAAVPPAAVAVPAPAPAPAPVAVQPAFPPVTPDTEIFQRTPKLDGVIDDGEWDTFYTVKSGDVELTTYADWDAGNLYVATKCSQPVDMLAILDANADGWYNGEDNYEFRVIREADTAKLIVSRYDSRRTKTPTASPVTAEEISLITVKTGAAGSSKCIEMSVPWSLIPGFDPSRNPRSGFLSSLRSKSGDRKVGLLLAAKCVPEETGWIASGSPGDCRECTLVNKKIASLKPLQLGFDLLDAKVARGEELVGKFHLTNGGADVVPVRSFVIAGEGKSGEFLSSQKIRMEGLAPKRHIAHEVRSVIPSDMPLGSWALGAEVKSADGKLGGALVSFEVVEPFEISLRLPTKPVLTSAKDVTLGVVITNSMRHEVRGEAKVALPAGWELWKNEDTREFRAGGESLTTVSFKTKPPLGVLGDVPVKFEVTINGRTVSAEGKFEMVNPPAP